MTPSVFFAVIRKSLFHVLTQAQVDGLNAVLDATDGLPISWRSYMLATCWHETARTMQPITEYGPKSYFDKYNAGTKIGARLGNTQPGDGYLFRGRGYVQLTGRANYAKAGAILGVQLEAMPDLALDPHIAAQVMVRGMQGGWFTGKKLTDYLPGDYAGARKIINGTDKAQTISGYARTFEAALEG